MIPSNIISTGSQNQINLPLIKQSWETMKNRLKGWNFHVFTDRECRQFILNNYGGNIFKAYEMINSDYGAAKADLFRYCAIYQLGGIYIDIKSSIDHDPRTFLRDNDELVLSHWDNHSNQMHAGWGIYPDISTPNGEFINWLIISKPRHPYIKRLIDLVTESIYAESQTKKGKCGKPGVLRLTGPIAFTNCLNDCISKNKNSNHRIFKFWENSIRYSIFEKGGPLKSASKKCKSALSESRDSEQLYKLNHYSKKTTRIVNRAYKMTKLEAALKLNLGCGNKKLAGFINIDQNEQCSPDLILNLENTPYPFNTNSVDYIRMDSVLEHFPSDPTNFFRILKEIYRISSNDAIIDILCPHPFHRWQIVDFTHQKPITTEGLQMLDKQFCRALIKNGDAKTPLALIYNIDFVLTSYKQFIDPTCKSHIENLLGKFEESKIESYQYLFNNIIGGQRIQMRVRK